MRESITRKPAEELQLSTVLLEEYVSLHGVKPHLPEADEISRLKAFYDFVYELFRADDKRQQSTNAPEDYDKRQERAALCLSGGGIRSATFNLGVLKGLARLQLLNKFDYLSTVSGGGYIGSWLSAWAHRAGGIAAVAAALIRRPLAPLSPESAAVENLRRYSNYLSPRLGFFSADSWTLAATYLRNLLLNWLVLLPVLVAFLALPRVILGANTSGISEYRGWLSPLLAGVAAILAVGALAYIDNYQPSSRQPEDQAANTQTQFLWWFLLPLGAAAWMLSWAWAAAGDAIGMMVTRWWVPPALCVALNSLGWLVNVRKFLRGDRSLLPALGGVLFTGAFSGFMLWLIITKLFPHPYAHPVLYASLAGPMFIAAFLLGAVIWAGITSHFNSNADLEWWARENGWALMLAVVWAGLSLLVLFGPFYLLEQFRSHGATVKSLLVAVLPISGAASALLGKSSSTAANAEQSRKTESTSAVRRYALPLLALLFLVCLSVVLSLLTDAAINLATGAAGGAFPGSGWQHYDVLHATGLATAILVTGISFLFGWGASYFVDVNKFSLHETYRNRLVRAYLGASNPDGRGRDQFAGFDESDNLPLYRLANEKPSRPLHLLNITLNLVRGGNLAWQQRKAESFTASPLHCGCFRLAYRRSKNYSGGMDHARVSNVSDDAASEAISLGTAMAISGAAASPNMGYHSSPLVALIMTLFNVRLGAWLCNPGWFTRNEHERREPKMSIRPLVSEAFGLTDDTSSHVYLSDGGHFENLGIYEAALRRCRYIVVSDAGDDPECAFEDLGNAMRKVRIDLGIPIEITATDILPRSKGKAGAYFAVGHILYSSVDENAVDGILIYIKPAFYGSEPTDVYNYAQQRPGFPHESTADQFFTESQFESYRALGDFIIGRLWKLPDPPRDFNHFAQQLIPQPTAVPARLVTACAATGNGPQPGS